MPRSAVSRPRPRLGLEALEGRANPVALDSAFGVGDSGEWAKDVAADALGNTYVVGQYNRTVDFDRSDADPATNPLLVLTSGTYPNPNSPTGSSPYQEGFVAKYDPLGRCVWAVPLGHGGNSGAERVALDLRPDGRGVVVTGYFQGSATFGRPTPRRPWRRPAGRTRSWPGWTTPGSSSEPAGGAGLTSTTSGTGWRWTRPATPTPPAG